MFQLIQESDNLAIKNTRFVKNAVFYKDLFAFYDAYCVIMSEPKENLPNYIFYKNKYNLDGICLFLKDYASEFDFESVRLTLEYLKVLYYTIASFSDDGNLPEKKVIEDEFNEYKVASKEAAVAAKENFKNEQKKYDEVLGNFEKIKSKYAKNIIVSKFYFAMSILCMLLGILCASVVCGIYYSGRISLVLNILVCTLFVVAGFVLYYTFKHLTKVSDEKAGECNFLISQKKKFKDNAYEEFDSAKVKYSKIACEEYEYQTNFAKEFACFVKKDGYENIFKKASEYKLLSYNLKLDIANLFKSQEEDVKEIIKMINRASTYDDSGAYLSERYGEIKSKDWLYYNNEVRFCFLKKFADESEKTFNWRLELGGEKVSPFGVDLKKLAKEKITYLKDSDSFFVASSLDSFLNTKYIKSTKTLELEKVKSGNDLRKIKLEYLSHFYDYEKTKNYDNLFLDKSLNKKGKISYEIANSSQKIPTFVNMKLKIMETNLGMQNADFDVIERISNDILAVEGTKVEEPEQETDKHEAIKVVAQELEVEDFGYYVSYNIGGDKFVGYKFV